MRSVHLVIKHTSSSIHAEDEPPVNIDREMTMTVLHFTDRRRPALTKGHDHKPPHTRWWRNSTGLSMRTAAIAHLQPLPLWTMNMLSPFPHLAMRASAPVGTLHPYPSSNKGLRDHGRIDMALSDIGPRPPNKLVCHCGSNSAMPSTSVVPSTASVAPRSLPLVILRCEQWTSPSP